MDFNHFIFYLHLLLYLAHVLLSIVRHGPLAIRSPLSLSLVVNGLDTNTGYGMQLTYDVPAMGQYNGVLCVRVCWHDIVYLAQVNFAQKALAF